MILKSQNFIMKIPWPPSSFIGFRYSTHRKVFCLLIVSILFLPSAKFESDLNVKPREDIPFSPALVDNEQCPQMLPKYFHDVQLFGGYEEEKVTYAKKSSSQTREQCVQLCCFNKNCSAVFMIMENSKLACYHVSPLSTHFKPKESPYLFSCRYVY